MMKRGHRAILIRSWLRQGSSRTVAAIAGLTFAATALAPNSSLADENGVSFWIPGFFGSLAATPQQPGWSVAAINYYTSVSASGNVAVSKEITIGQFNPALNASVNANISARADIGIFIPTYVFATPFLGGQASASLLMAYGGNDTALNATISGTLGPIPFTRPIDLSQTTNGFGDLVPQFAVRWNAGVNNYMTYITGDVPVGLYNSANLANLGIGHGAIDGGVGYTYFDPKTGHEFSAVLGLTGNFENPSTNYTNGIDAHLDWGASQFLTKQLQIGAVGYVYQQLTPDRGQPAALGSVESATVGVGPQIGYNFDAHGVPIYANLRGYFDLYAENRLRGASVFLTLNFPLSALAKAK